MQMLSTWKRVAIQGEKGKYLQCGRFICKLGEDVHAQAWYNDKIGIQEEFELEYDSNKGTFSFKSYNGLYLHYSRKLGNVAFKARDANKKACWHIHPLHLLASNSEHILFVGVVNKEKQFVIQRAAQGAAYEWNVDLDIILDQLFDVLEMKTGGSFEIFLHIKKSLR